MRIARRYLSSEIYRSSAIMLLALLGLFSFFSLIDELDKVGENFTLLNLFQMELFELPTRLYDLLPIGLLIGAILALAGLAQRNELVILRVSGVSGFALLLMLWLSTLPIMVGAFVLSEYITPKAEVYSNELRLQLLGKAGGGRLSSGYWFKENTDDGGTRIINIYNVQAGGNANAITILELDQKQELQRRIQAPTGNFHQNGLALAQATITQVTPNATTALQNARAPAQPLVTIETLESVNVATSLTAERLIARIATPERMAISDLFDYIHYLEQNKLQSNRQKVALWRKFAYPFTLLVMITIAAPISFMQTRRGGVSTKVFAGILIGVGFFMANQMALNIGTLSHWPAWFTALGPNLIALSLALIALLRIEKQLRKAPKSASTLQSAL